MSCCHEFCVSPLFAAGTADSLENRSSTAEKLANWLMSGFAPNNCETTEEAAAPIAYSGATAP